MLHENNSCPTGTLLDRNFHLPALLEHTWLFTEPLPGLVFLSPGLTKQDLRTVFFVFLTPAGSVGRFLFRLATVCCMSPGDTCFSIAGKPS